ncbi:cell division protein FtsK [Nocardia sp. N2S4-5]|uniref:cell division protein FtsK n=1 Tax=Nocardia sp. N2S4-5 TaxID=3351565 RepID=UPI0037CD6BB1
MARSEYSNDRQNTQRPDAIGEFATAILLGAGMGIYALVLWSWWAILYPMLSLPVVAAVAVGWWLGWPAGVAVAVASLVGWLLWWRLFPRSWERWVWGRIRQQFLSYHRYRRRWKTLTALHGLTVVLDRGVLTPRLKHVQIGPVADVLTVELLGGQTVQQWAKQSDALRHALRAVGVRVRSAQSKHVVLQVIHRDILTEPISLPREEPATVDVEGLVAGMTELGSPWRVRLLGNQLLVAGEMGSGKGSVAWSIIAALGPAIRAGLVELWTIDPKGGSEFGAAREFFARFAYDADGAVRLLSDAVALLQARGNKYMGQWERKITPSVEEPLVVVLVDEFASLTTYYTDRKTKEQIKALLGVLLTQSRAMAVPVIGCLQDPSKDVLELRQLFPYRIGLRMSEPTQAGMLFGPSGRDRGALCDEIPEDMPGVAYVEQEGSTEIVRVRAYWVSDDDIRWLIDRYQPRGPRRGDTRRFHDDSGNSDGDGQARS